MMARPPTPPTVSNWFRRWCCESQELNEIRCSRPMIAAIIAPVARQIFAVAGSSSRTRSGPMARRRSTRSISGRKAFCSVFAMALVKGGGGNVQSGGRLRVEALMMLRSARLIRGMGLCCLTCGRFLVDEGLDERRSP